MIELLNVWLSTFPEKSPKPNISSLSIIVKSYFFSRVSLRASGHSLASRVAPVGSHSVCLLCDSLIQASSQPSALGRNTHIISLLCDSCALYQRQKHTLHWKLFRTAPNGQIRLGPSREPPCNSWTQYSTVLNNTLRSDLELSLTGQTMPILVKWGSQPASVWERAGNQPSWSARGAGCTQGRACMLHAN